MTPKEKAIKLIEQFSYIDNMGINSDEHERSVWMSEILKQQCKQCALIAVDEIIQLLDHTPLMDDDYAEHIINYWQEVKQEIESL